MTIALLSLGSFVIAAAAFSTDMANLFVHRQTAQSAANAACTAGAMDMMVDAESNTLGNFTLGTAFSCATKSGAAPCQYASINGYSGAGLVADTASNSVDISFPSGASCPNDGCPAPGVTPAPASLAPYPFIRIDVVDRVKTTLYGMLSGRKTVDVRTFAVCGLGWTNSPVPIVVLNPSQSSVLNIQGTPSISVLGGPVRSIQVNSSSLTSVSFGGSAVVDLTRGGPNFDGSDVGVFGGPTAAPSGFHTANNGQWRFPSSPFYDPYALTDTPARPSLAPAVPADLKTVCSSIPCSVAYHVHGCPDQGGCDLYSAGYYSKGIDVQNATAIFEPGLYYLNGGLALDSNSLVRPSTGAGDNTQGTVFFLTGGVQKCSGQTGLVCVGANSGSKSNVDSFVTSQATCAGGPSPDPRLNLPATLNGNVLLAPCTGPYGDPTGQYRGVLFFNDRTNSNGGGWGGGGGFLLAGSIYFHHCNSTGTGVNCGAPPTYYNSNFSFQGNSGSSSYVIGNIIVDQLTMGGSPTINMALNPNPTLGVLKASLFF